MARIDLLLDTGPLVAFLNAGDQWHEWVTAQWSELYEPMRTCDAVLSECVFLCQQARLPLKPLLELFGRQLVVLDFDLAVNLPDVARLLRKYEDQPMSLADACLVRMAERKENCQVFTTDRDFLVYRRHGRGEIPLLAPF